ncbi:glycosyltransferase family 2 protein [Chryseobacterium binzhouense]|uniref:glycosyltransferase family 2 protein n=1 Tax=Chryseobacterium binzhouense TaxID=2593646 RepID=UPI00289F8DB2|nr:glycosyltransferase [Chryseobacterium binzhouense]
MTNLLVSVVMITYGHEKYIEESINGVLSQVLNGKIELLISDDRSPDDTESIVNKIISEHPNGSWIKYIKHIENKGAIPNFAWSISQAKGKYIAICEGDDYWTDPLKLQKQVDFLEQNPDFVLCFHPVKILNLDGTIVDDFITKVPDNYSERKTLAENPNYIHTPSVMFRNITEKYINSIEFQNTPIGDYFLYMALTKFGKIGFLNDVMAVYRYGVGIYSSEKKINQGYANILLYTNLYSYESDPVIKQIFYQKIKEVLPNITNQLEYENRKLNKIIQSKRYRITDKILSFFGR